MFSLCRRWAASPLTAGIPLRSAPFRRCRSESGVNLDVSANAMSGHMPKTIQSLSLRPKRNSHDSLSFFSGDDEDADCTAAANTTMTTTILLLLLLMVPLLPRRAPSTARGVCDREAMIRSIPRRERAPALSLARSPFFRRVSLRGGDRHHPSRSTTYRDHSAAQRSLSPCLSAFDAAAAVVAAAFDSHVAHRRCAARPRFPGLRTNWLTDETGRCARLRWYQRHPGPRSAGRLVGRHAPRPNERMNFTADGRISGGPS
jgi:hypothetical protein